MKCYLYRLLAGEDVSETEAELAKKGLQSIYVIEDDAAGEILIGGFAKKKIATARALLVEVKDGVDWEDQWSLFAEDFREGKAHIDLTPFGGKSTLELLPGAGFGDLSHPTTYLMLEMMQGQIARQSIVDLGSGSGILTLAALLLNAKQALGVEIDEASLKHARKNAKANSLKARFVKTVPKSVPKKSVFLLNMIFPEQKILAPQQFNRYAKLWIVSGILAEQKKEYLRETAKWGWRPLSQHARNGWLGFLFTVEE